jgi:hypothetical protein
MTKANNIIHVNNWQEAMDVIGNLASGDLK